MKAKLVRCGCQKHYVNHQNCVPWNGKQWNVLCAFHEQRAIIERLKSELDGHRKKARRMTLLQQAVASLKCPLCGKRLGMHYKKHGSLLYHPECLCDIGGEG